MEEDPERKKISIRYYIQNGFRPENTNKYINWFTLLHGEKEISKNDQTFSKNYQTVK